MENDPKKLNDADWVLLKCWQYRMVINWQLRTVKAPGFTRYWTWGTGDYTGVVDAVKEAVDHIEGRKA